MPRKLSRIPCWTQAGQEAAKQENHASKKRRPRQGITRGQVGGRTKKSDKTKIVRSCNFAFEQWLLLTPCSPTKLASPVDCGGPETCAVRFMLMPRGPFETSSSPVVPSGQSIVTCCCCCCCCCCCLLLLGGMGADLIVRVLPCPSTKKTVAGAAAAAAAAATIRPSCQVMTGRLNRFRSI
ncbi:hypothetical protein IWX50DRAFT_257568 [Phyllosticta citricarpa]